MAKTPYDYQKQVMQDLKAKQQELKNILLVAPTGAGKTLISAWLVQVYASQGKRVVFCVHRDKLVKQTIGVFSEVGIKPTVFAGKHKFNKHAQVAIASVQTLGRRSIPYTPDVLFLDEAHITSSYKSVSEMIHNPATMVVGLTGTPFTLGRVKLDAYYQDVVSTPLYQELMDMGRLVKPRYAKSETFNLVQSNGQAIRIGSDGDYNMSDLAYACKDESVINHNVDSWFELAHNRPTIVFCVNIEHSEMTAQSFMDRGVNAVSITSHTSYKDREKIYKDFENGITKVLTSCDALSEGFDVPITSCCMLMRPSRSKAKIWQMMGRGFRTAPNKVDCVIIDCAGALDLHGRPDDWFNVVLEKTIEKQPVVQGDGDKKTHKCKSCGGEIKTVGLSVCGGCQSSYVELSPIVLMKEESPHDRRVNYYVKFLRLAHKNGYAPGWAYHKYKNNYGEDPDRSWGKGALFGEHSTDKQKSSYMNYLTNKFPDRPDRVKQAYNLEFGEDGKSTSNKPYDSSLNTKGLQTPSNYTEHPQHGVRVFGIIRSISVISDKHNRKMSFVELHDDKGKIECVLFSRVHNESSIKVGDHVTVTGYKSRNKESITVRSIG